MRKKSNWQIQASLVPPGVEHNARLVRAEFRVFPYP